MDENQTKIKRNLKAEPMPVDRYNNYYYKGVNNDNPKPNPESCKKEEIKDPSVPVTQAKVHPVPSRQERRSIPAGQSTARFLSGNSMNYHSKFHHLPLRLAFDNLYKKQIK